MQLSSIEKTDASQPSAKAAQPAVLQRPKLTEAATAVWAWEGSEWPATATSAVAHRGERSLIVRFEDGLMASARPDSLEHLNPDLGGSDRPCPAIVRQPVYAISERRKDQPLRDIC